MIVSPWFVAMGEHVVTAMPPGRVRIVTPIITPDRVRLGSITITRPNDSHASLPVLITSDGLAARVVWRRYGMPNAHSRTQDLGPESAKYLAGLLVSLILNPSREDRARLLAKDTEGGPP